MKNPSHPHAGHAAAHGSVTSYTIGFGLSVLLTLASFGAVMSDLVPRELRLTAIAVLCVAQLLVQLVYFLHMGSSKDQRQNTLVFAFTALLIIVTVAGSLWVMHNADVNMMPTDMSPEHARTHE
jgi:cytochrome o ubiquinol oxidase operon protein cyoD